MQKAKQLVQKDIPAVLGRRQRIEGLHLYIEANRKKKSAKQILSGFCMKTGLRPTLVKEYFKLFIDAGIYLKAYRGTKWMIVTSKEGKK